MSTNPATPSNPEPTEPTAPVAPEPKKAITKKAATPAKVATPKAAKATTPVKPKPAKKAAKPIFTKKGWEVAITRNQALAAYRKQRTALHGAGPEAYRKAAAKALGIEDEVFEAAFYLSKSAPKAEPEGK